MTHTENNIEVLIGGQEAFEQTLPFIHNLTYCQTVYDGRKIHCRICIVSQTKQNGHNAHREATLPKFL
jgi:hypothetical protein